MNDGGFLVCKFVFIVSSQGFRRPRPYFFFQRVPGQPPLLERTEDMDDGDDGVDNDDAAVAPKEDTSD